MTSQVAIAIDAVQATNPEIAILFIEGVREMIYRKQTMMARSRTRESRSRNPLAVTPGFRSFVLDQLEELGGVVPRAMFGGVGLYRQGLFFGILAGDVLYLKADDETRPEFEAAGSRPFRPYPNRGGTMRYYSVPLSVLECAPELARWGRLAVAAAARNADRR